MANQITRDIYVLRKSIIEPIHYVRLTNAVDIVFNMRDYDIPSGAVAAVYAQKPDGTAVYSNATISENTVTVEMTTQMVAVLGVGHLQVRIQSSSNSADVLCSFIVPLIVEPNFTEGDFPPSQNENGFFGDVEEHLQQVESDMTTMKEEWTEFQSDITQQVQEIQEEQTTQGNEITALQKKVAKLDEEKSPALVLDASGSWVTVEDSGDSAANGLTIHGKSTQVVTTGAQLFDASKLESKSENGATVTNNGDGSFTISGSGELTGEFNLSYSLDSSQAKSLFGRGNITVKGSLNEGIYFELALKSSSENLYVRNNNTLTITEEFLNELTGASFLFYGSTGATIPNKTINPMVYQSGDGTWEPYTGGAPSPSPDYPQEIKSVGDGGSVEVVSTGENLYSGGDIQEITQELSKKISVPCPGAPLIIKAVFVPVSGEPNGYVNIEYYDGENKTLGVNGVIKEIGTQNTEFVYHAKGKFANNGANVNMADVRKIVFTFTVHSSGPVGYSAQDIMVCTDRDESEVTFSGYQSSTATFSTPNGLPGIPVYSGGNYTDADGQQWICDEIDTKAGVYRQRVAKKTYNGSESEIWNYHNDTGVNQFYTGISDMLHVTDIPIVMCKYFRQELVANRRGNYETIYPVNFNNGPGFAINTNITTSVTEWKQWLQGNPITVQYALATPVETPLSDAELISAGDFRTFATVTNATTEDPVEPEITLEHAADLKTYIDKKLAEISAATLENATNASQ